MTDGILLLLVYDVMLLDRFEKERQDDDAVGRACLGQVGRMGGAEEQAKPLVVFDERARDGEGSGGRRRVVENIMKVARGWPFAVCSPFVVVHTTRIVCY